MEPYLTHEMIRWDGSVSTMESCNLIGEEPLSIRIQGKPYAVVMRTPGNETAHAAGFCLSEGIADTPDDIVSIACCDTGDTNVVTVTLQSFRRELAAEYLERRSYISQTSCGICGKELVKDLQQKIQPLADGTALDLRQAVDGLNRLDEYQPFRRQTRASHAAALFDAHYTLLSAAEDVGRHNALDKAIGQLFLERRLHEVSFLALSSRISYELVQKAARARIPVILAVSRPTALAVELASHLNMALACLAGGSGLYIFCGKHRLLTS